MWKVLFHELKKNVHCAWPVCDADPEQIESRISAHAVGVVGSTDDSETAVV